MALSIFLCFRTDPTLLEGEGNAPSEGCKEIVPLRILSQSARDLPSACIMPADMRDCRSDMGLQDAEEWP